MSTEQQPQQLTVKEALEQGYKGYTGSDYECQYEIRNTKQDHIDFECFEWYLLDKEPTILTVSPADIYEHLADNFADNREISDDDEIFRDLIVGAVDWEAISCQINEKLKSHPVYFPTSIKLIPNEQR